MSLNPFILVAPATRGLSLALTRHFLRTTNLPVYATHRSDTPEVVHKHILSSFNAQTIDPKRLNLLHLELTSEESISAAAQALEASLPNGAHSYIQTAFFTGGMLHPERQPSDLDLATIQQTYQINVISHLLLVKHFSRFLPPRNFATKSVTGNQPLIPSKWVHVSARVGSISDNKSGGWFSYRSSKAALNQTIKTFDLYLLSKKVPAIAVGVHPGTVKTDLSKDFWEGVEKKKGGKLFEPDEAAEKVAGVVETLGWEERGRVWDWKGEAVPW
ncbi:hypothetical protein JAAARDRAFT_145930 [Jaapia argillacea MUCL 33604]|uniref:NAD(P)-binding protein n=1 Tax=Jaapia argillacea MUCL 33604 TaxID=933084 RepID=A0A067QCU8_9AGAM|nr:hypothetical protein JAAARDRAFT_145930 [Jaapia argillacea MUCL 33604]